MKTYTTHLSDGKKHRVTVPEYNPQAEAYEAGRRSFELWSEHEGTTKVRPSLFHIASQITNGDAFQFQAGWADARDEAERN